MTNVDKYKKAIDENNSIDIEKGDVRITLEYIGEGKIGDYLGTEDDVPLMRFTTYRKEPCADGTDHPDWNWEEYDNGSFCTQIPVDTWYVEMMRLANVILNKLVEDVTAGNSIKRKAEELSWIDDTWQ